MTQIPIVDEENFRLMVENSPISIVVVQDQMAKFINPTAVKVSGYSIEEVTGRPFLEFIHPEDRQLVVERHLQRLQGQNPPPVYEYRFITRSGDVIWLETNSISINWDGRPAVLNFLLDITERKRFEKQLSQSEAKLRSIIDQSQDGILLIDEEGLYIEWNQGMENIFRVSREEVLGHYYWDVLPRLTRSSIPNLTEQLKQAVKTGISPWFNRLLENRFQRADGEYRTIEEVQFPIQTEKGFMLCGIVRDITGRKQAESALHESEETYRVIFENTGNATIITDSYENTILMVNSEFINISGYSREEIEGQMNWVEFLHESDRERVTGISRQRNQDPASVPRSYEVLMKGRDGWTSPVLLTVGIIPGTRKKVVSFFDISERKRAEEQLKYLSRHDSLTGLFNRSYFEEEMHRLEWGHHHPLTLLICDVDGLKLINDTMGHDTGDILLTNTAQLIRQCFREEDLVARIGGDEFAVLLCNSPPVVAEEACQRLRDAVARHNQQDSSLPLNISIGYAIADDQHTPIDELYKEADNNMYREKLHRSQSTRSAIVKTLMRALEARDFVTEGHVDRLQDLVTALGQEIGLPQRDINDLRLIAQFHDIGKVGIPDRILFKPGPLTIEETIEMRRHSEIGHRIAQSAPDLVPIADFILKHHEWWDGSGYPLGLKGEEIPLECRIIAIADAYEAMTSNRPYRQAMLPQDAAAELRRCAGTQFDPHLVDVFIRLVEKPGQGLRLIRKT